MGRGGFIQYCGFVRHKQGHVTGTSTFRLVQIRDYNDGPWNSRWGWRERRL